MSGTAQNSAPKKWGVPFKSKAELNGAIDERINKGGRPKLLFEETAKYLARKVGGKSNARRLVESMGSLALKEFPHSVSAFRELRQTAEPTIADGGATIDARSLSLTVVQMMQGAAAKEKQLNDLQG